MENRDSEQRKTPLVAGGTGQPSQGAEQSETLKFGSVPRPPGRSEAEQSEEISTGHSIPVGQQMEEISTEDRAEDIEDKLFRAKKELQHGMSKTKDNAQEKAAESMDRVRERSARAISDGKNHLADRVRSAAHSLRDAQDAVAGEPALANVMGSFAGQVDSFGRYLADNDTERFVEDARRSARTSPALWLGGALAAGIVMGRFLKSSHDHRGDDDASESARFEKVPGTQSVPQATYGG